MADCAVPCPDAPSTRGHRQHQGRDKANGAGLRLGAARQRLAQLDARLQAFRQKLLSARNKLISHSDRNAILAGQALGGAPQSEWDQFWLDLQDVVCLIYEKMFGTPFYINGVAMLSDADGLLKALKHGACFDQLLDGSDPALTRKCTDLALS